jgi:hypothetical protein
MTLRWTDATIEQRAEFLRAVFAAATRPHPDPEAVAFLANWRAPSEGPQPH